MTSERIHVKIGEVRVAAETGVLFTIGLGSCVAVALYDPRVKVGVVLEDHRRAPVSQQVG